MEMASRDRDTSRFKQKRDRSGVAAGTRRRITKEAGKLADYSHLKATTGIVIPEVKKVLLDRKRQEMERTSHRTNIIYPSEMAKSSWCPRATYYRMSGLPPSSSASSFTLENVFAEGNAIHTKWQRWLAETGLLWGDWRCTRCAEIVKNSVKPDNLYDNGCVGTGFVPLTVPAVVHGIPSAALLDAEYFYPHDWKYKEVTLASTSHRISGHADGGLIKHNCLIEIKSLGVGTLRFEAPTLLEQNTYEVGGKKIVDIDGIWKNLHRPLLSHVKQGNIYLWMAKEMGLPFDSIVFLYEFKPNQMSKEFQIKLSEDILLPMIETAEKIERALDTGIPPQCPFNGCAQCTAYENEQT
jgi:hypothetical protein